MLDSAAGRLGVVTGLLGSWEKLNFAGTAWVTSMYLSALTCSNLVWRALMMPFNAEGAPSTARERGHG